MLDRPAARRLIANLLLPVLWFGLAGCEQQTVRKENAARSIEPVAVVTAPPAAAAFTLVDEPFIDRLAPEDLRVFNYNINSVFPRETTVEEKPLMSPRFHRLLVATQPDIITLQEIPGDFSAADAVAMLNELLPLGAERTWHAYKGTGGFMDNLIAARFPLSLTGDATTPPALTERKSRLAYALIDLPDDQFANDVYVATVHFKCCGGEENDPIRQTEIDALMGWLRDARTPGGHVDIPPRTALLITGDLNTVGGPQILATALLGDIQDEERFGPDYLPDWDDTDLVDAKPLHNAIGPDFYTWRDDLSKYEPGRLDYVIYSDSVLQAVHRYTLNTTMMTAELLATEGLEYLDVCEDDSGASFDHLPLVVDFRPVVVP